MTLLTSRSHGQMAKLMTQHSASAHPGRHLAQSGGMIQTMQEKMQMSLLTRKKSEMADIKSKTATSRWTSSTETLSRA